MTDPTTPADAIPPYVAPADGTPGDVVAEVKTDVRTISQEVRDDAKEALSHLLKFSRVPTEELARGIEAKLHAFIDAL